MLDLVIIPSAVLGKYSDLVVVRALVVVNAVLNYIQEKRAAGVGDALRCRLQVTVRARRERATGK